MRKLTYVVNLIANAGRISVIDDTNTIINSIITGGNPSSVAVNVVTGKVYVTNNQGSDVTAIDSVNSYSTKTIVVGTNPLTVGINMTTNNVYVVNNGLDANSVSVIAENPLVSSPLLTTIPPFNADSTNNVTPTFNLTATSTTGLPVSNVYYQVDSQQGAWQQATASVSTFSATTSTLTSGTHTIYAFAVDGSDSTSINTGSQSSPLIGAIASYTFTVVGASPQTFKVTPLNTAHGTIAPASQQIVEINKTASFVVTPDNGYTLISVTGCGGTLTGNSYVTAPVSADCDITTTFSSNLLPVRIGIAPPYVYYSTLTGAYAAALAGNTIEATMARPFSGLFTFDIAVTLKGGYDDTYSTRPGNTVVAAPVTVRRGILIADQLTVQ